jgi:hypothetical protein
MTMTLAYLSKTVERGNFLYPSLCHHFITLSLSLSLLYSTTAAAAAFAKTVSYDVMDPMHHSLQCLAPSHLFPAS